MKSPYTDQSHEYLLREYIERLRPVNILEWGPGRSTEIMLEYDFIHNIYSMEHQKYYFSQAKKYFNDIRLKLYLVEDKFYYYYTVPKIFGIKFQLIMVDGRYRNKCLETAKGLVARGDGRVLLHDAQRDRYKEGINLFKHKDWHKANGDVELTVALWN